MTISAKTLIATKYAAASATTEYISPIAPAKGTIIDKFTAANTDAADQTITVYVVPFGQTLDAQHMLIPAISIVAGKTYDITELQNHILNPGDFISVFASAGSKIPIRASGREIT